MNRHSIQWISGFVLLVLATTLNGAEGEKQKTTPPKDTVEGVLKIGEGTYTMTHVVVYEAKLFDEMRVNVLLCDKEIPVAKLHESLQKDGTDDGLFLFEPNVKITFDKEGKASSCNAWADNQSVSISGSDLAGEIKIKDGRVTGTGKLTSKEDSFVKCEYDVKFDAALIPAPKIEEKKPAKGKSKSSSGKKSTGKKSTSIFDLIPKGAIDSDDDAPEEMKEEKEEEDEGEEKKDEKSGPKGAQVNVYDLPMPKDSREVEYKQLVEHIGYKSASDVESVVQFLVDNLKKQGWESDDSDLITPNSSILKRELGEAELTIFVKKEGTGSKVTIMSDGLSWEKKKKKPEEEKKPEAKKP